jgi:hypothetical protein
MNYELQNIIKSFSLEELQVITDFIHLLTTFLKNMRKKLNLSLISVCREYSYTEIAELYNLHIRTIQIWKKEGLNVVEGTKKPILVLGSELKKFLLERQLRYKKPLKIDEFYCTRCNEPRTSVPDKVFEEHSGKMIARNKELIYRRGVCIKCSCPLFRFSSEDKIKEDEIA